jgi:hypothetical protein
MCFDLVCSFSGPLICGDIVGARKNVPITVHYWRHHGAFDCQRLVAIHGEHRWPFSAFTIAVTKTQAVGIGR